MSSRRHFHRSERYECGEGGQCHILPLAAAAIAAGAAGSSIAPIAAGALSAGLGYLSSREQSRNARAAMRNQAAYAQPRMWRSAQPHARSVLSGAGLLASQGLFGPKPGPHELFARKQLKAAQRGQYLLGAKFRHELSRGLVPTPRNRYINAMVEQAQRGLREQYSQNILPSIANQAQAMGGFGGSRQGVAQGLASKALMQATSDIENKIRQQGYAQALQKQRTAFQHLPSAFATLEQPAATSMQIAAMERDDRMQQAQNLLGYQAAVAPYTQQFPGASSYPPQYAQANPWTGAIQGAATGLGIHGMYRQLQANQFRGGGYNPMGGVGV